MDIANGIGKIKGGYSSNEAEFAKALYRLLSLIHISEPTRP